MNRSTYIIIEESRLVPKEILEAIIKPFLYSRKPPYMSKPPYETMPELVEEGRISYITSAWFKSEYWYQYVKQCIKRMINGDETSNFLATDYLVVIYHGIKTKTMIESEKADIDPLTFSLEYENIPAGQSGKSYYRINMFSRNIKKAFYPPMPEYFGKKNPYEIKRVDGEIRIVAVDIATRANRNNDNSVIACIRLIPTSRGYERNLVYLTTSHGESTITQALDIKRIFYDFNADFCVLDLQQAGIAIADQLSAVTHDDMRGVEYEGWTVLPHKSLDDKLIEELQDRAISLTAKPVIYPILASQRLNNDIAVAFRTSLQKKMWHFLASEADGEDYLLRTNKEFSEQRDDINMRTILLAPYVQSDFLVYESVNLEFNLISGLIKLTEPTGGYKDRYTAVSYANWFIHFLDNELIKEAVEDDDEAFLGVSRVL